MTTATKKRPKRKVRRPSRTTRKTATTPTYARPRDAALAGELPVLTDGCKRDFRGMFQRAFDRKIPSLHETLLLAGFHHKHTHNLVIVADRMGVRVDAIRESMQADPGSPMDARGIMECEDAFASLEIDGGWLAMFHDAHCGFFPQLRELILGVGYREDDTVDTQRELGEWLDVDERTIRRWIQDGSPVKRVGNTTRYSVWGTMAWKHGTGRKDFSPPGAQIAAMREELIAGAGL